MIDPNRVALFERVARRGDVELLVVYETVMEANRKWAAPVELPYRHEVLRSRSLDLRRLGTDAYLHLPRHPLESIRAFRPEVLVAAGGGIWSSPANVLAYATRRSEGWAFVPWWGSFGKDHPSRARMLAERWVRRFLSQSDLCIAYGSRSSGELRRLGVDPAAIHIVPNAVPPGDTEREESRPHRPLRYLFVGQLIERKGVPDLLAAFSNLPHGELYVAGDGPLRDAVIQAAQEHRVVYVGHLGRSELHALYARTDVLVLPSRYEVWGLVVNEAMGHGLPVIASDAVGAVDDLIEPGVNGYVFRAGDRAGLQDAMAQFASWDARRWLAAANTGATLAHRWSMDAAAEAFVEACHSALRRREDRAADSATARKVG